MTTSLALLPSCLALLASVASSTHLANLQHIDAQAAETPPPVQCQTTSPNTRERFCDIVDELDNLALELDPAKNKEIFMLNQPFDIEGNDLMVYLHIQKTGGTWFGKMLVDRLRMGERRQKLCMRKQPGMSKRTCSRKLVEDEENPGDIRAGWKEVKSKEKTQNFSPTSDHPVS